jgi:formylglycine-generating enzyme required for sulfatase activity
MFPMRNAPLSPARLARMMHLDGLIATLAVLVGAPVQEPAEPAPVADANATTPAEMKPYRERIAGSDAAFDLVVIPGGRFRMGSEEGEAGRKSDEGPVREVDLSPFWMGRCEVTWDEYHVFMDKLDLALRKSSGTAPSERDARADAVSHPTPPYAPMDFGMGVQGYPAVCMTQFAAKQYTDWLSAKTGRFYRLPTEAEWEYACRAGTTTAYSFGDDPKALGEFAWFFDNANDKYQKVGTKKPNAWGLCDMHGNVAEWCLDRYDAQLDAQASARDPVAWPDKLYPRIVRGGSYNDDPPRLRSAARRGSKAGWTVRDPQLPKSIWYHTDAAFVGFRLVRPLATPTPEEMHKYWDADLPEIRAIQERQRAGGR